MSAAVVIASALLSVPASQADTPWMDAALETARWLNAVGSETEHGKTWPVQVDGESRTSLGLYDGAPGVVLFLLEAHAQTEEEAFLREACAGADDLLGRLQQKEALDPGLYTGLAGLGFTFCETFRASGDTKYRDAANRVVSRLVGRAVESQDGIHWNGTTDVISGSAGIGLFLLYAGRELERKDAAALAARAADHLIRAGQTVEAGSRWAMNEDYPRRMPNFSHGTAGIGYFLVEVYRSTDDRRYLEAARRGGSYLRSIAAERPAGGKLVHHSDPGNEDLFYLSWCHGPPGTVRFLHDLALASGDEVWQLEARALAEGLSSSGIPARSDGFWNNAGACCGDAGVADFLLEYGRAVGSEEYVTLGRRMLASTLARSTVDEQGRRWTHAEHRVRPEQLSTQTGLMQGAAGIGLVLLRADARERGRPPRIRLPDEPWSSPR